MKYPRSTPDEPFATDPRSESLRMEVTAAAQASMHSEPAFGESAVLKCLQEWDLEKLAQVLALEPELDIFEAAALGKVERVAELLMASPTVAFVKADDGFTPLHLACFYGQHEVVKMLVDCGVAVSAQAENGATSLHEAASTGQFEIVTLLLGHGAEVDAADSFGSTALHVAASHGHLKIVEALLHAGATFRFNLDRQTPRDLAQAHQHAEILQLWTALMAGGSASSK